MQTVSLESKEQDNEARGRKAKVFKQINESSAQLRQGGWGEGGGSPNANC